MSQSIKQDSIEKAYLVGVHRYCFRAGQKGEIMGVKSLKPPGDYDWRFAYEVKYEDDVIDYVAMSDVEAGNWELVNQVNADLGLLPKVIF